MDEIETMGGFRGLTSAGKLQSLESKLALETLMSGIRSGSCQRAVRPYVSNIMVDGGDFKNNLRNCMKQLGRSGDFLV